jgi:hypothetical protein
MLCNAGFQGSVRPHPGIQVHLPSAGSLGGAADNDAHTATRKGEVDNRFLAVITSHLVFPRKKWDVLQAGM